MKKLGLVFFALVLTFTSCTSSGNDDSTLIDTSTVFLKKKILSSNGTPPVNIEVEYQYNGNKIDRIVNSSNLIVYTYTGDLITKVEHFNNNQLTIRTIFTYDSNNRITSEIVYNMQATYAEKTVYSYATNSLIDYEFYTGDHTNQTTLGKTGKIYLNSEGEKIKVENFIQGLYQGKSEFTYGNKCDLFKNVICLDKKASLHSSGTLKNLANIKEYDANNNLVDDWNDTTNYGSNGFPTTYSKVLSSGVTTTTQFIYY